MSPSDVWHFKEINADYVLGWPNCNFLKTIPILLHRSKIILLEFVNVWLYYRFSRTPSLMWPSPLIGTLPSDLPVSLTSLSSADSVLKRPMASLMTSVSSRSGLSAVMLFLFSSSQNWKPVFGLKNRKPVNKTPCTFNFGSCNIRRSDISPLVLCVISRRGWRRGFWFFLPISSRLCVLLSFLIGRLGATHLKQSGLGLQRKEEDYEQRILMGQYLQLWTQAQLNYFPMLSI